jgi:hypothetical protein
VLPTILDLVGLAAPDEVEGVAQSPVEGSSFASVLVDAMAPATRTTQYFEMLGSRALYHDGWKAVTFKPLGELYDDGLDPDAPFDEDRWELYHVAVDPSECHDLAGAEPDKLAELVELWWHEARAHQVLPLDNRPLAALMNPRPSRHGDRDRYVYRPWGAPVPETVAVNVRNRSHVITVDVEVPAGVAAEGVLLAQGSVLGGWVLYLLDGRLRYVHNLANKRLDRVVSDTVVGPGGHRLVCAFTRTADFTGSVELFVDGDGAGSGEIAFFTPARFSITGSGLTCGYEVGPAISPDYAAPFGFTGAIRQATVDVSGVAFEDLEARLQAILAEQ